MLDPMIQGGGGGTIRYPVPQNAMMNLRKSPMDMNTNRYEKLVQTPSRDIVDRCRVWESHADPEVRRISKPMPEPAYPTYVIKQPDYETEPVCGVTVNKPNRLIRVKNC